MEPTKKHKFCKNDKCKQCYDKSFTSNNKSQYWIHEKNKCHPKTVFKCSSKKYWFRCDKCPPRLLNIYLPNR